MTLSGIIPPLATPFKEEELDLVSFRRNLTMYNQTRLHGYLVLGSNGEAAYLEGREREMLIVAARDMTPPDKVLLVGTGCESTRATIQFTKLAGQYGANYALVLPPSYYRAQMTKERLFEHYQRVADGANIPILLYNVPFATGINMTPDLVLALARHPNIVGIKDSSGDMQQLSEIIRLAPKDFAVLVGASPMLFPALCLGAAGGILAVANVVPSVCLRIFWAFEDGDYVAAHEMHHLLAPLAAMVTSKYGVAGLKLAMNLAGLKGGDVRSPLTPIKDPVIQGLLQQELDQLTPCNQ